MTFLFGEATPSGVPMAYFQLVYVVGFIAAVVIGSIAWYNSKRPPGWENAARPDFVPDVEDKPTDSSSEN
ncbi:MAG: photosystem II assembly protein Psb35 [Leptolyngbyaceae cyanobacterium]